MQNSLELYSSLKARPATTPMTATAAALRGPKIISVLQCDAAIDDDGKVAQHSSNHGAQRPFN